MKSDSTDKPPTDPVAAPEQGRGLEEFAAGDEFPEGAAEFTDEVSRRRFIGLMGASLALATGAGSK